MPIRGETIGRAYVRILADGAGLPKSIRDEMDDVTPVVKDAADKHGKEYAKGFEHASQKEIGSGIRDALEKSIGRTHLADTYFQSRDWRRFLGRLKQEFGKAGVVAGHELETQFAHNTDGLAAAIERIGPRIDELTAKIKAAERESSRSLSIMGSHFEDNEFVVRGLNRQMSTLDRFVARMTVGFLNAKGPLERFTEGFNRFGDRAAIAFGRGSRNNLLNFFGSMVGNLTRLPGLLASVFSGFLSFGAKVSGSFVEAGGGVVGFVAALGTMSIAIVPALIGLGALIVILSLLTSAITLLAGAIIAVTSAITFGLIGAIAPLVGALSPLALGVAATVAAFVNMNDAQKKLLKEAVEPLKQGLSDLGDAARPGILDGITRAARILEPVLKGLRPLFRVLGRSVGDFIAEMARFGQSRGFQAFVDALEKTAPASIRKMGRIFTNVMSGLGGVFAALNRPGGPVAQFLTWLDDITQRFDEWANSREGRREIVEFFKDAADSAKSLGSFLDDVWDLIKKLFFNDFARTAGGNILESLGQAAEDFSDSLTKGDLREFFENSEEFADNLGKLAEAILKLADALNRSTNIVLFLLDIAAIPFEAAAKGLDNLTRSFSDFKAETGPGGEPNFDSTDPLPWLSGVDWGAEWSEFINSFKSGWSELKTFLGRFDLKQDFEDIKNAFRNIGDWVSDFFGGIDIDVKGFFNIGGTRTAILTPFTGLAKEIVDKLSFDLPNVVKAVGSVAHFVLSSFPVPSDFITKMAFDITKIIDGLGRLAGFILSAFPSFNDFKELFPSGDDIAGWIGSIDLFPDIHWPDPPSWLGLSGPSQNQAPGPIGGAPPPSSGTQSKSLTDFGPRVGKTVQVGSITLVTPTKDPAAAATEVLNQLAATAYF